MIIHHSPERSIAGAVGPMWSWPIKSIPDHSALESLKIKSLIIKSLTIKSTPGHSTIEVLTGKSDIGDDEDDGDEGDDYGVVVVAMILKMNLNESLKEGG